MRGGKWELWEGYDCPATTGGLFLLVAEYPCCVQCCRLGGAMALARALGEVEACKEGSLQERDQLDPGTAFGVLLLACVVLGTGLEASPLDKSINKPTELVHMRQLW